MISLVVTVGSDHHPFDRLIGWVDEWLAEADPSVVHCTIQYGTAVRPTNGESSDFVAHDVLQAMLDSADIVLTQGGPMGIVESRRHGIKPIAVPRLAKLGEVVDDHQVAFCRAMATRDQLVLAEDRAAVWAALDAGVRDPGGYRVDASADQAGVQSAVRRFADLAAGLFQQPG